MPFWIMSYILHWRLFGVMATFSHADEKLEAAHHKFHRRLLGITWEDRVRTEEIRKTTRLRKLELIVEERRLRWLGWRTPEYLVRRYSGNWWATRESQGKTGWTSSDEIWRTWTLPGKELKNWRQTSSRMMSTCGPCIYQDLGWTKVLH